MAKEQPPLGEDAQAREAGAEMAAAHTQGQPHDRIPPLPGQGDLDAPSAQGRVPRPADSEVTIGQKMLSAVSGSILTSLLGMVHVDGCSARDGTLTF